MKLGKSTNPQISFAPYLFRYGGPYHIQTIPLNGYVNQRTGFYMKGNSAMKELVRAQRFKFSLRM